MERAYRGERQASLLYRELAHAEMNHLRREALEHLSNEEAAHAELWAAELRLLGQPVPLEHLSAHWRALLWLAKHGGLRLVAPLLAHREHREAARYQASPREPDLRLQERHHARVVGALARGDAEPLAVYPWSDGDGFNFRAAIFGVNDGLVSTLSLTAGLAGAHVDPSMIVLGGIAGLLAGALSMAGGEFLSVRTQEELMARQFARRRIELTEAPEGAARLLASVYQRRGVPAPDAERVAKVLVDGQGRAPDATALGSPTFAAISSFLAFAAGALIPLIPYLLFGESGLTLSIMASAGALAGVGAVLGFLSERSPVRSAARMLTIGGLAAAVTYAAGLLFQARSGV